MKKVKEWKSESDIKEIIELQKAHSKRIADAINRAKIRHNLTYVQNHYWGYTLLEKIHEVNKEFGGNQIICSSEISFTFMDLSIFVPGSNLITTSNFNFLGMVGELSLYVDCYLPAKILIIIKEDFFTCDNPECAVIFIDVVKNFTA